MGFLVLGPLTTSSAKPLSDRGPSSLRFAWQKDNAKTASRKHELHLKLSHYLEVRPETPCGIEVSGPREFHFPPSGSDTLQKSECSWELGEEQIPA